MSRLNNRERGTVTVEVEGQTWSLVLDLNAMVAVEGHFSTPGQHVTILDVAQQLQRGSLTHARVVVWASLMQHHPDATLDDAGRVMLAGGATVMQALLTTLTQALQADPQDLKALGVEAAGARPRPAQPGASGRVSKRTTGAASISPPGVAG
jgi:hypothetical protein